MRETIESVAIAFVLAFLFRTFEAEAFVIPTGSMAPTLMGRHKDLVCPKCHYAFQASASEEVEKDGSSKNPRKYRNADGNAPRPTDFLIDRCVCPMCRYEIPLEPQRTKEHPSFNGDRILVNKFAYEFHDPERWDVVVFKYPKGAQENYIKRLVGLPEEELRVRFGDVWVQKEKEGPFNIQRKSPHKLRVMLQPVFENDLMPALVEWGWPVRWRPESLPSGNAQGAWTTQDSKEFQTDGRAAGEVWLRYRHLVPSPQQWKRIRENPAVAAQVQPQLITDFTAYNTSSSPYERDEESRRTKQCPHWVGDLALECEVEVENDQGYFVLELVKGGRRFQCRIDVASGRATLSISGTPTEDFHPQAQTPLHGPGTYRLRFANCDQRLYLWVDGKVFYFDTPTQYSPPQQADLQPAGIVASGVKMKVRHLKISRDVYYIATRDQRRMYDYYQLPQLLADDKNETFFSDPRQWHYLAESNMRPIDFPIPEDSFLVLGDNSAKSADSRVWEFVSRELMIGKAFLVYWPHSWHRIPYLNIPFPYFPNFARMGFVR